MVCHHMDPLILPHIYSKSVQVRLGVRNTSPYIGKIPETPGLFQIHTIISFPFLLAKELRRFLLITRTCSFLALLYVGGTYARLVYTWYKNIFHIISVLIVFIAANGGKGNVIKSISKRDINETETRQCNC